MREDIGWGKIIGCILDLFLFIICGILILLGDAEPIIYFEFYLSIAGAVLFVLYHIFKKY